MPGDTFYPECGIGRTLLPGDMFYPASSIRGALAEKAVASFDAAGQGDGLFLIALAAADAQRQEMHSSGMLLTTDGC